MIGTGIETGSGGKRQPTVTVENPGHVHALLREATIRVSQGGWSKTLQSD